MEDIARCAGVGVGTVYRHFPTKEALITALTETHFDALADTIEASLHNGDGHAHRPQAAGRMRSDATVDDIRTVLCGFGAAAQRAGASLGCSRYLTIVLDGLRAR